MSKITTLIIGVLLMGLISCSNSSSTGSSVGKNKNNFSGNWFLHEVELLDVKSGPLQKPITLKIEDGKFSGTSTVNNYGGDIVNSRDSISFENVHSTKMAGSEKDMKIETAYFLALASAKEVSLDGDKLVLSAENGKLHFVKVDHPMLDTDSKVGSATIASKVSDVNGSWNLKEEMNGSSNLSMLDQLDNKVTLIIGEDGSVSGNSGANNYRSVLIFTEDSKASFAPIAGTKALGSEVENKVEEAYLSALQSTTSIYIEENGRYLHLKNNNGILVFEK